MKKILLVIIMITTSSCLKKNEIWGTWQQEKAGCAFSNKTALNLTILPRGLYYLTQKEGNVNGPIFNRGEWDTNIFGDLVLRETLASSHFNTYIQTVYNVSVSNPKEIKVQFRNGIRYKSNTKEIEIINYPSSSCTFSKSSDVLYNNLKSSAPFFSEEPEQRDTYISSADIIYILNGLFIILHATPLLLVIRFFTNKFLGKNILNRRLSTAMIYSGFFLLVIFYVLKKIFIS